MDSKTWKKGDSTTTSHTLAETDLPGPFDPLVRLISGFAKKGLSTRDMVALLGSHSIGQVQCFLFRDRIYSNGTDIDAEFASTRRRRCPQEDQNDQVLLGGRSTDDIVLEYSNSPRTFAFDYAAAMVRMEDISPIYSNGTNIDAGFASTRRRQCPQEDQNGNLAPLDLVNQLDNNYYKNLIQRKVLQSDQVLLSGGSTDNIVIEYTNNPRTFAFDFAAAMIKMGDINSLTGQNGIIGTVCGAIN
ncbi:hypothetical protein RDI58_027009 [Solanum bulbocastanum]|uniref:peroxidase n=1 Tax=Solanum bulbocastanum TaxID=147425 RepID=A0AAN8Y3W5_SOLBU